MHPLFLNQILKTVIFCLRFEFWPKLYYIVHKCKNVNHHPSSFWKLQFKIKSPVSLVIVKSKYTCFTHMSFKLSRDHFIICHLSGKYIVGIYLSSFIFYVWKLFYFQKSSLFLWGSYFAVIWLHCHQKRLLFSTNHFKETLYTVLSSSPFLPPLIKVPTPVLPTFGILKKLQVWCHFKKNLQFLKNLTICTTCTVGLGFFE